MKQYIMRYRGLYDGIRTEDTGVYGKKNRRV